MASNTQYSLNPFQDEPIKELNTTYTNQTPFSTLTFSSTKPPWLNDSPENSNDSQRTNEVESGEGNRSNPEEAEKNNETTDKDIPNIILMTRIINIVLSILMFLTSFLAVLTTQSMTSAVLALYLVVFSLLLCCYEVKLKYISKLILYNFGFLYHTKSRCLFFFFLITILYSFSFFGKVISLLMLANLFFNLLLLYRHPQLEMAYQKEMEKDLGDYLRKNEAFRNMVQNTGKELIMKNPEIALQGIQTIYNNSNSNQV